LRSYFAFVEANVSGNGPLAARAAADIGLTPVMVTGDAAQYPWLESLGSIVVDADTADPVAVLTALGRRFPKIAGVTSTAEFFYPAAAEVARQLGLPGPDPSAILCCRDKAQQRRRLARAGLPVPKFAETGSAAGAVEAAKRIGLPVVAKPVDGSGSVNVALCATLDSVEAQAQSIIGQTHNIRGLPAARRVLIEQFLEGPEVSVETLHGNVIATVRKHLSGLPRFVETGHDVPAGLSEHDECAVAKMTSDGLRALAVTWGVTHTELRLTRTGPVIVEINPRMAGGHIPEIVLLATGVDLPREAVLASTGKHRCPGASRRGAAAVRFVVARSRGVVEAFDGLEAARGVRGVREVSVVAAGSALEVHGDVRDRIGYVITVAETLAQAAGSAQLAVETIRPRVTSPVAGR
jgi:S-sulfo-L-cysteine synthase (3-phospho-L-serine-dependent)